MLNHCWSPVLALCLLVGLFGGCTSGEKTGLTASFYTNAQLTGQPIKVKQVNNIDFDWGADKPLTGPWGIVFTGSLYVPQDGYVTFSLLSDDGAQLEIDGKKLVSNMKMENAVYIDPKQTTAGVDLKKGWHRIKVSYFELGGGAFIHLKWQLPDSEMELIPQRYLKPEA